MKSKIKLLLSCVLILFITTLVVSCGDDDDKKQEATVPEVYFISFEPDEDPLFHDETIKKFKADNPANTTVFLDITGFSGSGVAYDATHDKIYFSDFYEYYEGKIWSVNAEGSPVVADDIVGELYQPFSIAIDESAGKIYYADGADGDGPDPVVSYIYRANLDGSSPVAVVTMDDTWFRSVAIDPANNKMYFYDVNSEDLYVANLDGTNPQVLIPGIYGYSIQIDTENDKIYFDDQNSGDGELKMADLDGENIVTVDETASRIYGIAIDNENEKLYWSASGNGEIYQSDLDGSNKIVLKTGLSSPRGLFLKK